MTIQEILEQLGVKGPLKMLSDEWHPQYAVFSWEETEHGLVLLKMSPVSYRHYLDMGLPEKRDLDSYYLEEIGVGTVKTNEKKKGREYTEYHILHDYTDVLIPPFEEPFRGDFKCPFKSQPFTL